MLIDPFAITHFSCIGKKSAKRSRHKGHCASRSRAPNPSPCVSPAALTTARSTLTYIPEHDKNVPIFAVQGFCFWNSAGRRERSRRQRPVAARFPSRRRNVPQIPSAPRVGYIGEGVSVRGSALHNASPMPLSLVTFLCGHKKVTFIDVTININLSLS